MAAAVIGLRTNDGPGKTACDTIADVGIWRYGFAAHTGIPPYHCAFFMKPKNRFECLCYAVCVGHGYCGGRRGDKFTDVTDYIPETGAVTADQFVEWVFLAEYGNRIGREIPDWEDEHRRTIRGYFVEHMGSDVVNASELRFAVRRG